MLERLRRLDPGYFVVVLICFLAIWPFLANRYLPEATDAELHVYRLAELGRLVRGGIFLPRWAPNFYFGYGYPIFNYYAPLAYYLGLPLELLPGVDAVAAVKAIFIASLLVAGLSMYGFVRDNWGRASGLVAAAVYVYSPYILYVDPHARGDLAETVSFALFPIALWALDRLRRTPSLWNWLGSVVAVGALILSHNLMAMVFYADLLAWSLWQLLFNTRAGPAFGRQLLLAALIVGVGIAAFFWLPVGLERNDVNLTNVIGESGHFDFRNHFLRLAEILGPSLWLDWGASSPDFRLNIGLAQWLLGLLGIAAIALGTARRRRHASFFLAATVMLLLLMTRASQPVWEVVPLMPFLQFPWRLLGATAAMLAVLSGVGIDSLLALVPERWARWIPVVAIVSIVAIALPLTQVPPWSGEPWDTSAYGVMQVERQGRWLGTTSTADFIPTTVDIIPRPQDEMLQNFADGKALDRVNRATLPDGTRVIGEEVSALHTRYRVGAPEAFLLRLYQFDFPGWEVEINGQPAEKELGRPEGFITVPVPAGDHIVDVQFGTTPARQLGWGMTITAAVLASLVGYGLYQRRYLRGDRGTMQRSSGLWRRLLPALLALTGLHLLVLGPQDLLHLHSQGNVALPADREIEAYFGDQIALVGFDAPAIARAGEEIEIVLYWKAQEAVDSNYQVFVHLIDDNSGRLMAQSDKLNPGDFPTKRWSTENYVRDEHRLQIPAALPPGRYALTTGLWLQSEGLRLPVTDENGAAMGDNLVLQYLQVENRD